MLSDVVLLIAFMCSGYRICLILWRWLVPNLSHPDWFSVHSHSVEASLDIVPYNRPRPPLVMPSYTVTFTNTESQYVKHCSRKPTFCLIWKLPQCPSGPSSHLSVLWNVSYLVARVWRFHSDDSSRGHLGCDYVQQYDWIPLFRRTMVPPSSRWSDWGPESCTGTDYIAADSLSCPLRVQEQISACESAHRFPVTL